MDRNTIIENLGKNPDVDVLIIGGGINGAGAFLDLAINDVRVLLIDRKDFCSGTSATSSHMAHGGIRYLENGEFRLVKEAVAERNRMIENAPHMVKPLPTVIPIFKFWSGLLNAPLKFLNWLDKPSERGALVIKIGLILYDSFTGKNRTVPGHKFFGKKESLRRYPLLNKEVKYTAEYYDGLMLSPERYNTEIILDAEKMHPNAMAINYVSLDKLKDGHVILLDHVTNDEISVNTKIIVNAAGPWIDDVNSRLGIETRYIGGTKGSHIIVNNPKLKEAIGNREFFFENKDGRIVLLLPFFDKVIIGTSDIPIDNPDSAICTPEEEKYFIDLVKRVFPDIPILPEQIVFRFSGVRPLEYQETKTTGQITRDHSIRENTINDIMIMSMVGGKWTSFRAFGEQVADRILGVLNQERKASTEHIRIGGGIQYPLEDTSLDKYVKLFAERLNVDLDFGRLLFERYGTLIEEIFKKTESNPLVTLKSNQLLTENEILYLVKNEKVVHLDDLLLRRSSIGWMGQTDIDSLVEIAQVAGTALRWGEAKVTQEIERVRQIFKDSHNVVI
jgi:glycerol-3-phosphate dehydrogenase